MAINVRGGVGNGAGGVFFLPRRRGLMARDCYEREISLLLHWTAEIKLIPHLIQAPLNIAILNTF